ncbi:MAG: hypothetical protein FJ206_08275 [Gemmatimonadetes bacterium]|nr:hypothetical protein [Gemmatimonadota bacterium]
MRRLALAVLAVILGAHRSAAQEASPVPRTDWGTFMFERDIGKTTGQLGGNADAVYAALPAAFAELGLTPKAVDPANRVLELKRHRLVRKLGKDALSRFLSCGDGLLGPNADSYYVYLTLTAQVTATPNGRSLLTLYFTADAVNVPGGQSDRLPCATTGLFEHRLVTKLQARFPST